jgi:hypothetical protein
MARNHETAALQESPSGGDLSGVLLQSRVGDDVRHDQMFLREFNHDLDRNAKLSRLNEQYLSRKMEELDRHHPIFIEAYVYSRARLHELLLLCAANYANNCEYGAVGDLMFNPRLTLIHIRGRHSPVVKERHTPLSEQFADRAGTHREVMMWLREETTLEIKEKPLIPHSYELLENAEFMPGSYLDSARDRAVQIADLSAFLACRGFEDRMELDEWLRNASPTDRALMESRLLPLDWSMFREFGALIRSQAHSTFSHPSFSLSPP